MEVTSNLMEGMRGKLGNLIFYTRNGKTYVKRAQVPGKKRKPRTERQRAVTTRFGIVQELYSYYRKKVSPDIWRIAAKERGRMAPNLFHSANCVCFDGKGEMVKPDLFRFAEGSLQPPSGAAVERLGEGRFRATWMVEAEEWTACAGSDRLMAGVIYTSEMPSVCLALEASGRRADGAGEFLLRTDMGTAAHVYLFFARADGTAYSPSLHFEVEV